MISLFSSWNNLFSGGHGPSQDYPTPPVTAWLFNSSEVHCLPQNLRTFSIYLVSTHCHSLLFLMILYLCKHCTASLPCFFLCFSWRLSIEIHLCWLWHWVGCFVSYFIVGHGGGIHFRFKSNSTHNLGFRWKYCITSGLLILMNLWRANLYTYHRQSDLCGPR